MGTLLTICPVTGHNVETGIETDRRTFANSSQFSGRVICSACGQEHAISHENAWVCDTIAGVAQYYPDP